jgi:predicted Rossmann fold nucleotide-binding protein DprA/Smf involved in DNA uptake
VKILAIVGSRSLRDREPIIRDLIEQVLDEFAPAALVSGGATGVDQTAENAARQRGLIVISVRPGVQRWSGPGGYQARNRLIVHLADQLVSIEDVESQTHGAAWTRRLAREAGKPTWAYLVRGKSIQAVDTD